HAKDVELLAANVFLTHVNVAADAETCADGRGCHTVLAGARLRDNARLTHASRKQSLAKTVVDLVRSRVIQVFALQIDFRAAPCFRQPFSKIQWCRPAGVCAKKFIEFGLKPRVPLRVKV